MEKLRDSIEKATCSAEAVKNLAMILEDYFFNNVGNKEVNKYMFLAMAVAEKTANLEQEIDNLWHLAKDAE